MRIQCDIIVHCLRINPTRSADVLHPFPINGNGVHRTSHVDQAQQFAAVHVVNLRTCRPTPASECRSGILLAKWRSCVLRRKPEPQERLGDAQRACPASKVVQLADRRSRLYPADLRLGQSQPPADHLLRNAILAVRRDMVRVLAVRPAHLPDVLSGKRVPKLCRVPKLDRDLRRPGSQVSEPPLALTTQVFCPVATQARPTAAITRRMAPMHRSDLTR